MILHGFFARFKAGVYIGDFIYGANDGIVTTFAVVAGAAGALLSPGIVIVLGLASLGADAFSMGASNFLAIRSEKELEKKKKLQSNEEISFSDVVAPLQHGVVTFTAFMVAGVAPLFPYLLEMPSSQQFFVSGALAAGTFFVVGGIRTFITGGNFVKAGLEVLLVGGVAAGVAYTIGWGVKTMFGVII
ncbi:MAG: VIT1/CCC1 transporter family protein [bacterium]|nr:VIT1/CCC1 transporter family protein [bacterium]